MSNFYNDGNVIETALVKCDKFDDGPYIRLMKCFNCCNHYICKDLREQERQKKIKESEAKPVKQSIYFDESHRLFHEFVDTNQIYVSSRNPASQPTMTEVLQRWAEYGRDTQASAED